MEKQKTGGRALKRQVRRLLKQEDLETALETLGRLPARQVVNPLFSFFCSTDEMLKWHAVSAMGAVVAGLFQDDPEPARVVMRRLIWSLNDESGGIGWGAPEALAEVMVHSRSLADEFSCLLISYIDPDGNYLEHEMLQRGALWALARLAHARPQLMTPAAVFLPPYLRSGDPFHRGLAAWAAAGLADSGLCPLLEALADDPAGLQIYRDGRMKAFTVDRLARTALSRISAG